jgi:hypothetical protein
VLQNIAPESCRRAKRATTKEQRTGVLLSFNPLKSAS